MVGQRLLMISFRLYGPQGTCFLMEDSLRNLQYVLRCVGGAEGSNSDALVMLRRLEKRTIYAYGRHTLPTILLEHFV